MTNKYISKEEFDLFKKDLFHYMKVEQTKAEVENKKLRTLLNQMMKTLSSSTPTNVRRNLSDIDIQRMSFAILSKHERWYQNTQTLGTKQCKLEGLLPDDLADTFEFISDKRKFKSYCRWVAGKKMYVKSHWKDQDDSKSFNWYFSKENIKISYPEYKRFIEDLEGEILHQSKILQEAAKEYYIEGRRSNFIESKVQALKERLKFFIGDDIWYDPRETSEIYYSDEENYEERFKYKSFWEYKPIHSGYFNNER